MKLYTRKDGWEQHIGFGRIPYSFWGFAFVIALLLQIETGAVPTWLLFFIYLWFSFQTLFYFSLQKGITHEQKRKN